jgi:hypothetical protein
MKITSIDPFSIREDRTKVGVTKDKPRVGPTVEVPLDPLKRDSLDHKVVDIIEEAQKRAKKKGTERERRRKKGLTAYTKAGFSASALQEKGKKLDTRV